MYRKADSFVGNYALQKWPLIIKKKIYIYTHIYCFALIFDDEFLVKAELNRKIIIDHFCRAVNFLQNYDELYLSDL